MADESEIMRKAFKTFIEQRRLIAEADAEAKGEEFDVDDFIVHLLFIGTGALMKQMG